MIREGLATDAASIARIQLASWRYAYRGIIADDYLEALSEDRAVRGWLAWFFERDSARFCRVVADDAGHLLGYAMGGPGRSKKPFVGEIQVIYMHPDSQRRGHGSALLRSMARGFEHRGKRALEIWSLEANRSRPFYDRMGGQVRESRVTPVGKQRLREVQYVWPRIEALIGQESSREA